MSGVLLLGADYYGTLAAARQYGKAGIRVTMADENENGRALASRWVDRRLVHPPLAEPEKLLDWLYRWGEEHPGTFLYPPNDHLAWLFSAEKERLSRVFRMYSPGGEAVISLLDKKRLHDASLAVGMEVPVTEAPDVTPARFPVLVKPRTQVFLESGIKGFIAADAAELKSEIDRYRSLVKFHRILTDRYPDVSEPMVQEYLTAAETSIFSVSGFVDERGNIVARAAMKVLQRPRKVGIGLCFEGREIEPVLVEKLAALAKHLGYHGTFESEFIADGDKRLLIDFNPRFYSQMGFDVARGLPLPLLVYHAAHGDTARVDELLAEARAWKPTGREGYCHKTMLDLVLTLQAASGRMPLSDVRRWRTWVRDRRATLTDAVRDKDDPRPALVDAAAWARHFAKHPRSFIRSFVLNR